MSSRLSLRAHLRNHVYGLAAILIALAGTAYAATSFVGKGGQIRGCVSKKGQLTVLKPPRTKCARGLTAIKWSQKGPAGKTGAQGQQGLQGAKGDPGPATGPAGGDLSGNYPNPLIALGAITDAKVAAANKDGAADVPSLRTLGSGALQAMPGNATPGGPPTGNAGGALAGTYPNPTLNVTGGPCPTGKFLTNISNLAGLTCGPNGTNTALGASALAANTTGLSNTAVGNGALGSNTTSNANSAFGLAALQANTIGDSNSAFGRSALLSNTTGSSNTAVGDGALFSNTTGELNSALGQGALDSNTVGIANSAVGNSALGANTTGGANSAVGFGALDANTTGADNSAFGTNALTANTTGQFNVAVGVAALANNNANDNSAVGQGALGGNTSGAANSALGQSALASNTTGDDNSAVGQDALDSNTTGASNVAIGQAALTANTTGGGNTAVGTDALDAKSTGANNVVVGKDAGGALTGGSSNTLFGTGAGGALATTDSSNVDIANAGVAGDSNTIRIGTQGTGTGQQNQAFMAGVAGSTVNQTVPVLVGSDGKLGTAVASSERLKTGIQPLGSMDALMRLRPVSYFYKGAFGAGLNGLQYGLIAEEVDDVLPALVQRGPDGRPNGVLYGELPVLLLAKVQDQQREIEAQNRRLRRQQAQINRLLRHEGMR